MTTNLEDRLRRLAEESPGPAEGQLADRIASRIERGATLIRLARLLLPVAAGSLAGCLAALGARAGLAGMVSEADATLLGFGIGLATAVMVTLSGIALFSRPHRR